MMNADDIYESILRKYGEFYILRFHSKNETNNDDVILAKIYSKLDENKMLEYLNPIKNDIEFVGHHFAVETRKSFVVPKKYKLPDVCSIIAEYVCLPINVIHDRNSNVIGIYLNKKDADEFMSRNCEINMRATDYGVSITIDFKYFHDEVVSCDEFYY